MSKLFGVGPYLNLAIRWHPPVWLGKPRARKVVDTGVRNPEAYRALQREKRRRRLARLIQPYMESPFTSRSS